MSDTDLERRLERHFQDADDWPVPVGKGSAIAAMAGRKHRRRKQVTWVAIVLGMVAMGVGLSRIDVGSELPVAEGGPDGREAMLPQALTIEWGASTNGGLSGYATKLVDTADATYAISTAPGDRGFDPQRHLYTSQDGLRWTSLGPLEFGQDHSASDIASVNGRLYVVGTAPATRGDRPIAFVASGSGDLDGWALQDLDPGWVDDDGPFQGSWSSVRIAASGDTTLVALSSDRWVDFTANIPAEFRNDERFGWTTSPDGVSVVEFDGSGEREVWSATLEELGLDGPLRRLAMWVDRGDGFVPVDWPEGAATPDSSDLLMVGGDSGFLLGSAGGGALWTSPDGVDWSAVPPFSTEWTRAAGEVGGRWTIVAESESGQSINRLEGGEWVEVESPASGATWMPAATIDRGVLAMLTVTENPSGNPSTDLFYTDDLETWRTGPLLKTSRDQWIEDIATLDDGLWLRGNSFDGEESIQPINLVARFTD